MGKLIDADMLNEKISNIYNENYKRTSGQAIHDFFNAVMKAIRKAPAVDAVPVVHGWWESGSGYAMCDSWQCSECGNWLRYTYETDVENVLERNHFCCNCGAKMDGKEK